MEQMLFPVTRKEAERSGIPYSAAANKDTRFPSQLRDLRKKKGVSQKTLSEALGVSKSTVGLWETGDTLPDAKSVHDLADYFEVSADYIVGRTTVFSTDSNLRNACEYTGLSEGIISTLAELKSESPELFDFLAETDNFLQLLNLLTILCEYSDSIRAESIFWKTYARFQEENKGTAYSDHEKCLRLAGDILTDRDSQYPPRLKQKINQIYIYELTNRLVDLDIGDVNVLVDLKVSNIAEYRANRALIEFLGKIRENSSKDEN